MLGRQGEKEFKKGEKRMDGRGGDDMDRERARSAYLYPLSHSQVPRDLLHCPLPLHSEGHSFEGASVAQSTPLKSSKHTQVPLIHSPVPLQFFGQSTSR